MWHCEIVNNIFTTVKWCNMSSCMTSHLLMPNDCALPAEEMAQLITNNGNGFPRFQNMTQRPLLKPPVTRWIILLVFLARLYVCSRSKWIENKWTWQILRSSFLYLKTWLDQRIQIFGHRCFPLLDICDVKTKHSCSEGSAEDVETYTLVMQWSWYSFYLMMTKPCLQWL